MLIPTFYDDDEDEYWHLLKHVTLWDVAVERQVEITGPDAFEFTNIFDTMSAATPTTPQPANASGKHLSPNRVLSHIFLPVSTS